jgi:hypothetical protein
MELLLTSLQINCRLLLENKILPLPHNNNVIAEEEQVPPAEGALDFPSTTSQEEEHTANIPFVFMLVVVTMKDKYW